MATFIIGLPGETREDTRESLELLYALKDARWVVIPTVFVPLEQRRPELPVLAGQVPPQGAKTG